MCDGCNVIESERYRDEVKELMADPIIQKMAQELPPNMSEKDLTSGEFMMRASHAYRDFGGTKGFSIGGPAEAIIRLYRKAQ